MTPKQLELARRRQYEANRAAWEADCAPDCRERAECEQDGDFGHFQCGTCAEHAEPRHHCGCIFTSVPDESDLHAWMAARIGEALHEGRF